MPRKPLSNDLCRVLIYMHHKRDLSAPQIAQQTSLNVRTVQHVLRHFHETGVQGLPGCVGVRPGRLNDEHFEVRRACPIPPSMIS